MRGVTPVLGREDIRGSMKKSRKGSHSEGCQTIEGEATTSNGGLANGRDSVKAAQQSKLLLGQLHADVSSLPMNNLLFAMASCHSITIIDKKLVSD